MTTEEETPTMSVSKKKGKAKKEGDIKVREKVMMYHFKGVQIGKKKTHVHFTREIVNELKEGEEENTVYLSDYPISSEIPPHKDFLDALKNLRKPGLELSEIEIEASTRPTYNVIAVKIKGDMEMQQSRAEMVIGHKVKRTDKIIKIPTGEYVMYGDSDFANAAATTKLIEKLKEECWAYAFEGKYGSEDPNQLPLFTREEQAKTFKTNFVQ